MGMLQIKNIPEGMLGQNLQHNISKYIISQDKYIDNLNLETLQGSATHTPT